MTRCGPRSAGRALVGVGREPATVDDLLGPGVELVDDVIEVEGALQRRFWRGESGVRVAHEVECRKARKVRTPARPAEAETA